MQRLKVDGRHVSVTHLGDDKVEYLLAGCSPDLIEEITTAVNQTSYVISEETSTSGNRVVFQLKTDEQKPGSFNDLRNRVARVIVTHMKHDEKRKVKKKKTSRGHTGNRSPQLNRRALAT